MANFLGRAVTAVLGMVFIPLYIRTMGVEAYGLIGLYATMAAVFGILDLGFSTTLNREFARALAIPGKAGWAREVLRTLQSVYWSAAMVIGVSIVGLAPLVVRYWISPSGLTIHTVETAVRLIGVVVALQMVYGFYSGGLLGSQKHVFYNLINVLTAALRLGGGAVILIVVSPTIVAFFLWQTMSTLFGVLVVSLSLWSSVPKRTQLAQTNLGLPHSVWRFAAGLGGASALGLLLSQADKLVLSKMLPLEDFGYYVLAATVAGVLHYLGNPIYTTMFPSFVQKVESIDLVGLKDQYHKAAQLASVVILPVAGLMVFYSEEIMHAWTMNSIIVENTRSLVSLLGLGNALSVLSSIPYGLQLAHGWTSLTLVTNVIAIFLAIPGFVVATAWLGSVGAAIVWIMLNFGYLAVNALVMHRRVLAGEQRRWLFQDVMVPVAAVFLVAVISRLVFIDTPSRLLLLTQLGGAYIALLIVAISVCADVKRMLAARFTRLNWLVASRATK